MEVDDPAPAPEAENAAADAPANAAAGDPPAPPPAAQPAPHVPITTHVELPPEAPRAAVLQHNPTDDKKLYWDRSHYSSPAAQRTALTQSSTLYVGNLNFSTRQVHIRRHFESLLGPVRRVVLGLDRMKKTPCGFCFVEYCHRPHALQAVSLLSGTKLDGKVIRVELDAGFQPGRQYGRGVSGGQVRDDRRAKQESGRKRSHYEAPPPVMAPTIDGALPSARNESHATSNTTATATNDDNMDTEQGDEPAAKRRKM